MPIYNLQNLRDAAKRAGVDGSDEFLIQDYAKRIKMDPRQVADRLGYDGGPSTMNRERMSASVDNYQANLYDTGRAVSKGLGLKGVSEWMDGRRQDNQFQADVASGRASRLGAVDSYKDIDSVGSFGNYAVGLGIQSLPYIGESVVGGLAARGAMTGTRAALKAADSAGDVAGVAKAARNMRLGTGAGAVAASYPSSVGDILSSQRDQNPEGETRDLLAAVGGVPYAALNALSPVDMAAARLGGFRSVGAALDRPGGLRGAAVRTAATGARVGVQEGLNEVGQEAVNQTFGRMAVDPNETFLNERSAERFGESFVGGAVLGGALGGGAGGWRRSQRYADEQRAADRAPQDILDTKPPLQLGWDQRFYTTPEERSRSSSIAVQNPMTVFPDGSTATNADDALRHRYGLPLQGTRPQAPTTTTPPLAQTMATEAQTAAGAEADRPLAEAVAAAKADRDALAERTKKFTGVTGTKAMDLFAQAEELLAAKRMSDDDYVNTLALISRREFPKAAKIIKDLTPEPVQNEQRVVSGPAVVAANAPAGGGAVAGGSDGNLGRVAPNAGERNTGAASAPVAGSGAAPVLGPGPAGGVPAAVAPAKPAAPVVTVDPETGVKKTVAPYVEPKSTATSDVETDDQADFRKQFAAKFSTLDEETANVVGSWLGITTTPDGGLELTGAPASLRALAQGLTNTKTKKKGISHETVRKRIKKALKNVGAPADMNLALLYKRLGFDLADLDLDTLNRMAGDLGLDKQSIDEANKANAAPAETEDSDGSLGSLEADADITLDADESRMESNADDDAGDGPVAQDEDAIERALEEKNVSLMEYLGDEVAAGSVTTDDITETAFLAEKLGQRWDRISDAGRATLVRAYARARLAGDAQVLQTKKEIYERDQAAQAGRTGQAADSAAAGAAPQGAVAGGQNQGVPGGTDSSGGSGAAVQGNRPAPVVKVKKKRTPVMPGSEPVTTGTIQVDEDGTGWSQGFGALNALKSASAPGMGTSDEGVTAVERDTFLGLPGVAQTRNNMRKLGLGHLLNWIEQFRLAPATDPNGDTNADGWVSSLRGARPALTLKDVSVLGEANARWVFAHEMGHVADLAHLGGVYSIDPRMAFGGKGDNYYPTGAVAREAQDLHDNDPTGFWNAVLQYPMDGSAGLVEAGDGVTAAEVAQGELFAQLFALYVSPKGRLRMQADAPQATAFMKEAISAIRAQSTPTRYWVDEIAARRAAVGGKAKANQPAGAAVKRRLPAGTQGPVAAGSLDNIPPPPGRVGGVKGFADSLFKDGLWRTYPTLLGWMSGEQLGERFGKLANGAVTAFADVSARMAGRATQVMAASDKVKREWETFARDDASGHAALSNLLVASTTLGMWPNAKLNDPKNAHVQKTDENKAAHADLEAKWNALSPAGQALYSTVLKDFDTRFKAKVAGLRAGIVATYYPGPGADGKGLTQAEVDAIAGAKSDRERSDIAASYSTTKRRAREARGLSHDLAQHADTFKTRPGPYFPLMRFGKHIVSVKSAAYQDAERQLVAAQNALAAAENDASPDEDLKDERGEVSRATAVLNGLRSSGNDYRVEFFETIGEARERKAQLGGFLSEGYEVNQSIKDDYLRQVDAVSPTFMKRLEEKLGKHFEGKESETIRHAVREMYVQMLPETSMLKSQLKRGNVTGVKPEEALRSFAASSVRDAHGISRLEYQSSLREQLDKLRFDRSDLDAKILGQELAKRLQVNFEFTEHPVLSQLSNATYLTYLGLSPSFLLMQVSQPWFVSAPIMAARHSMGAIAALKRATNDAVKVLWADAKAQKSAHFSFDPDRALKAGQITQDEALMLRSMLDNGRIDITITQDLGATAQGKTDNWLTRLTQISAVPAQQIEVANRVATALAAYRLEKQLQRGKGVANPVAIDAASKYASTILGQTHLNYASENRARHMHPNTWGGWGRIMFQFRSYQQGMVYLVMKNLIDGFRGDKEARKASAYLAGVTMAAAGTTGLPGAATFAFVASKIYDGFKDEDEEKDLGQMLYAGAESVLGETAANALIKGVPTLAGVDISNRVGLGSILSPAPYADDRAEGRDMVSAYWVAVTMGAAGGMLSNWAEAAKHADNGDFMKATQTALPKVASDLIKAGTQASAGRVDAKGRQLVAPEELGVGDAAARALGFATVDESRMRERRGAFFDARGKRDEVRQRLLTKFARTRIKGEAVTDILKEIQEFNARHPDARITPANRESAVRATRTGAKEMRGGVPVRERDQALADELGI